MHIAPRINGSHQEGTNDASLIIAGQLAAAAAPCITCSFQLSGVVVLHMLRKMVPDIPVLFIDTFHHFEEIYAYRDELVDRWNLNVVDVKAAEPAVGLWQTSTDACCARHKVEPLFAALEGYDVWFTGLRRDQSPTRAHLAHMEPFRLPSGRVLRKVNPVATWTDKEIQRYAREHAIPLLPLYAEGYTSIGCEPCTTVMIDPSNLRSGRWRGEKQECGIHIQPIATAS
jgi:phosphoadenosine phosphosulfate reductase